MQTRSRKISEVVGDASASKSKTSSAKNTKRAKATLSEETMTPSKVQKADTLVENILKSVQKIQSPSENGIQLKGNDKLPASEKTKLPKVPSNAVPKVIRGQPKSGRPWKDVKQK